MKSSKQEIIIHHSAKDLYKIVLDIEKYPEFIPWCHSIDVKSKSKNPNDFFIKGITIIGRSNTSMLGNVIFILNNLII